MRNLLIIAAFVLVSRAEGDAAPLPALLRLAESPATLNWLVATLALVAGCQGVVLGHLLRVRTTRHVLEPTSVKGLAVGEVAPNFRLPDLTGAQRELSELVGNVPLLVVFVDPRCEPCEALVPELVDWHSNFGSSIRVLAISGGTKSANSAKFRTGPVPVLIQRHDEVAVEYGAQATPTGFLISADGLLLSDPALGADRIRQLAQEVIDGSLAGGPRREPPEPGELAPRFSLHSPTGPSVDIEDALGQLTILLFWSSTCSFCRELRPAIAEWEAANSTTSGVRLILISSDPARVLLADRFGSDVGLDAVGLTARAYGVTGTPTAILVDGDGRVATEPAQGVDDIVVLLRRASEIGGAAVRLAGYKRRIPVTPARTDGAIYDVGSASADLLGGQQ